MNLLESIAPFDGYVTAIAQDVFGLLGLSVRVQNRERLPPAGPTLIVCNHRSFLDPFILTSFLNTPIDFVCHRYMGNVPVLREVLQSCGGFPLTNGDWYPELLNHARDRFDRGKTIGIFPEGAAPMLAAPSPTGLCPFYRGFAHVALQAAVPNLQILPVAILSQSEIQWPAVPLSLLHYLDPSEPLFRNEGWHPAVVYQQAIIRIGKPFSIAPYQQQYHGRQAGKVVKDLTATLSSQVADLLAA
ncbi:lysophospholipid acyltransferase family protein [Chamaesiphon sp. VAR_69_metabat_338]|uniref:lysophospholipid acyltransferase family protein n=1 Tax=Chamaesiphon sp. VAR_69_metabat_338 TaxID=2964704 RepID=UPI00286DC1F5|nr:lysophospholipid acyltransferase family protein [Chamaesiphon sp. VAR_69_metabat_338]